jgi:hypothetical protein
MLNLKKFKTYYISEAWFFTVLNTLLSWMLLNMQQIIKWQNEPKNKISALSYNKNSKASKMMGNRYCHLSILILNTTLIQVGVKNIYFAKHTHTLSEIVLSNLCALLTHGPTDSQRTGSLTLRVKEGLKLHWQGWEILVNNPKN